MKTDVRTEEKQSKIRFILTQYSHLEDKKDVITESYESVPHAEMRTVQSWRTHSSFYSLTAISLQICKSRQLNEHLKKRHKYLSETNWRVHDETATQRVNVLGLIPLITLSRHSWTDVHHARVWSCYPRQTKKIIQQHPWIFFLQCDPRLSSPQIK